MRNVVDGDLEVVPGVFEPADGLVKVIHLGPDARGTPAIRPREVALGVAGLLTGQDEPAGGVACRCSDVAAPPSEQVGPVPAEFGELLQAKGMWDEGGRWDEILVRLRAEGFSKVDCIRPTVEILRLPPTDAKRLVHESRAWADRRESDDEFHEVLEVEFRTEASGA